MNHDDSNINHDGSDYINHDDFDINVEDLSLISNPLSDDTDYYSSNNVLDEDENNLNAASTIDNNLQLETINDVTPSSSLLGKNEREGLMSELRHWAIKYKICLNAIGDFFRILRKYIRVLALFLPNDSRTFLRTPRKSNIINLAGGLYWHYGLRNIVEKIIIKYEKLKLPSNNINLILNVDGLPLVRSSTVSFWPILVSEIHLKNVYMVGCYYGNDKPSSANDFLKEFVYELININHKLPVQVSLYAIVCNAPAKSFILSTKSHTGYSNCSKCCIYSIYKNSKVSFIEHVPSRLRTLYNADFINQTDTDYHKGETILTMINNLDLVTNVPLNFMHLICFGSR